QAVEFAKEAGIAIYARATASPLPGVDPSSDGTVVRRHGPRMPGTVTGVASEEDVFVLQAAGDPAPVIDLLHARSLTRKQVHAATFGAPGDGVTLVISRENLHDEERLRRELGGIARLIDGLGAVSVVGAGINATYRTLRQGTASLEREGIGAQGIATSSFRI